MRVEATKVGFYVKLRSVGDRFEIPDDRFSSNWMKLLEAPKPETVEEPEPPKRRGRPPKKAEG